MSSIQLEGLSKSFSENEIIKGIDLEVNKERIIHYLCQYKNDNSAK